MDEQLLFLLKKYWGYNSFRPLQKEVIHSILSGKDTLALMPTGGGKSLCFQVPAMFKDGICLVVSPLIALMKDQVFNLKKRNIPAVSIFSGMNYREIDRTLDNCIHGGYKFLYLSPERLVSDLVRERIKQMQVNLLTVDEAHCISQWGYDFRPPYLQIAEIREFLPETPLLALTATATGEVIDDIQNKLLFQEKNKLQISFKRDNLSYVVLQEENKPAKLLNILQKVKGSGIVYARNRKLTKEIARYLVQNKISAGFYHAGLPPEERTKIQEDWIANKIRIVVCTNAFGMGIDKPDVRSVVHLDLPDSPEAYFQEAGRAGRDGKRAYAVLLYADADKANLNRNFSTSYPEVEEMKRVYQALGSYFQLAVGSGKGQSFDFDISDFSKNFQFEILKTYACLKTLEQEGWLTMTESFYLPSTFTVLVSREQLYDFQLKNPNLDLTIKTLLRVSEGAFFHYTTIQERAIAKFLKIRIEDFIAQLNHLKKEGIIDYNPSKDQPQLVFMRERVDVSNLTIDLKRYNFLKERQKKRIESSIDYASTTACRSVQLLKYFGEDSTPCGICDVCLGKTEAKISTEEFERYKTKIQSLLKKEKLTENELLECFSSNRQPAVIQTLEFLLDEKWVVKNGEILIWSR